MSDDAQQPSTFGGQPLQDLFEKGKDLRRKSLSIAHSIQGLGKVSTLPEVPPCFLEALSRLDENEYRVVVIGEIKKGKSCFINTLLGFKLLPEDVPIATSQAFRIQHGPKIKCRVRFEDNSEREIDPSEICLFGSQVAIDSQETPKLDQVIRWIEIEVSFQLLPTNLVLFDTPGLGGLLASHEEVTNRVLAQANADAVIFVLDSEGPVTETELGQIEKIVDRIPHLFFIQTKIDLRDSSWLRVKSRSEETIRSRFGAKLKGTNIWPISSLRLRDANEISKSGSVKKEAFERAIADSHFLEFLPALMTFLFRVVGWSRAFNLAAFSTSYFQVGHREFDKRLAEMRDESGKLAAENEEAQLAKRLQFSEQGAEWSRIISNALEGFSRVSHRARTQFSIGLTNIESQLRDSIELAQSFAEIQEQSAVWSHEFIQRSNGLWNGEKNKVVSSTVESLREIVEFADDEFLPSLGSNSGLSLPKLDLTADPIRRLQTAGGTASSFGMVFGGVPMALMTAFSILNPPLAALAVSVGAIASLLGLGIGWNLSARNECEQGRMKMLNHLQRLSSIAKQHYCANLDTLIHECESSLKRTIREASERKRREADAEILRIETERRMTSVERLDQEKQLKKWIVEWEETKAPLMKLHGELEELYSRLLITQKKAV